GPAHANLAHAERPVPQLRSGAAEIERPCRRARPGRTGRGDPLRVALFSDERSHSVRFQFDKDELKIVANSEAGETEDSIAVSYSAPPFTIGFNWQYLLDFLGACGPGKISLEFKDEQSAG